MNPAPEALDETITVRLDAVTYNMLQDLKRATDTNGNQIIRALIKRHHAHTCAANPTCATGSHCLCPHLHQFPKRP